MKPFVIFCRNCVQFYKSWHLYFINVKTFLDRQDRQAYRHRDRKTERQADIRLHLMHKSSEDFDSVQEHFTKLTILDSNM